MNEKQEDKVLIIGAGLGGLALAQILYYHNVPFEIFERDHDSKARKQGWAVALKECIEPFQQLVSDRTSKDLYTTSVNANTDEEDELAFVDAITCEKVGSFGRVPPGHPGHLLRSSREKVRAFLWQANDLPVSAGKHFTHYKQEDGHVTAYFDDGTNATWTLMVGSDGLHSRTLDQLIGASQHKLELSAWIPIVGEVNLPKEVSEPLHELSTAAVLAAAPNIRLQLGMLSVNEDRASMKAFWALTPRSEQPEEEAQ